MSAQAASAGRRVSVETSGLMADLLLLSQQRDVVVLYGFS